jgi:hypothetical protein
MYTMLSSRMSSGIAPGSCIRTGHKIIYQTTTHTPTFIILHDFYRNSIEAVESVQKDGKVCVLDIVSRV